MRHKKMIRRHSRDAKALQELGRRRIKLALEFDGTREPTPEEVHLLAGCNLQTAIRALKEGQKLEQNAVGFNPKTGSQEDELANSLRIELKQRPELVTGLLKLLSVMRMQTAIGDGNESVDRSVNVSEEVQSGEHKARTVTVKPDEVFIIPQNRPRPFLTDAYSAVTFSETEEPMNGEPTHDGFDV